MAPNDCRRLDMRDAAALAADSVPHVTGHGPQALARQSRQDTSDYLMGADHLKRERTIRGKTGVNIFEKRNFEAGEMNYGWTYSLSGLCGHSADADIQMLPGTLRRQGDLQFFGLDTGHACDGGRYRSHLPAVAPGSCPLLPGARSQLNPPLLPPSRFPANCSSGATHRLPGSPERALLDYRAEDP